MSLLSNITHGKVDAPLLMCLYGTPGVGKTTFVANMPCPVILCAERGADQLDVPKIPRPESWEQALGYLRALADEPHDYKTLAIDTADALEELAVNWVLAKAKKATLADFDGGGGYFALRDQWRILMHGCEVLRNARGMNVVFLAHSDVKPYCDPSIGTFDRTIPRLDKRVWGLINDASDVVGFCQFEAALYEGKQSKGEKNRGMVTGARLLHLVAGTGYLAKNRHSLPATLPLSWDALQSAIAQHGIAPEAKLREELTVLLTELDDSETSQKSAQYLKDKGDNAESLAMVINSVRFRLDEKRSK